MSERDNGREIAVTQEKLDRAAKRYLELEGKHGRLLPRLNQYATEMADLSGQIRRYTRILSLARRNQTKGDDKRG